MSTAKSIEHSTHSCENHLVSYIRIASQEGQEIDREHMNNICLNICMYSCTLYKCIAKSPSVEERLIRCKGPAAQYANQVAPVPLVHVLVQTSTSTIYSITILVQICQLGCTGPLLFQYYQSYSQYQYQYANQVATVPYQYKGCPNLQIMHFYNIFQKAFDPPIG